MALEFHENTLRIGETDVYHVTAGEGPPLLLLHGYPQTHRAWRAVAERLADRFTVILPDLPGYGRSRGPAPDPGNVAYSKRAMARTMVGLMAALGHETFHVAGHDRGGRVAYRLCLDHPRAVRRLAVVDILPTSDVWAMMTAKRALATHHWLFLAQPAPVPERMISADPALYIGHLLDRWVGRIRPLDPEDRAAYIAQFEDPAVVAATCADYRAGATVDWALDEADRRAGRRILCPTTVIWGTGYLADKMGQSPLTTWRNWCEQATETALPCGHFVMEEAPDACADALRAFMLGPADGDGMIA
ncbi:alpha/beta fold hydrolase [Roseospira navarrensis]|uniref:Alpha/beta fold hydrolase n=1 Tax=Roseospira navarrensis TaxID=140058 RepID=A0A7X1ZE03_9PROT|nr:alpha/beta hydrolase [Roseospira navarrensis]MQX36304.1 alpha/beta fold hydrolase [Roseospira navarrensis]